MLAICVIVQTIEDYVLTPLIQKRAVKPSPVLTLSALMLVGAWFGALGIALATPIAAALRVAVLRLYVEDRWQRANSDNTPPNSFRDTVTVTRSARALR